MNFRDVELLSAYLDGRLSPSDSARLEARLSSDQNLKVTLDELRETRGLLRRLPQRRAPRSFRLTPKMAGLRAPEPRAYPIFRVATALATLLFVASVALNELAPLATRHLAAAPAPAFGLGGGGGGGPDETSAAPAATEAPVQPFASVLPTSTPEGTQEASVPPNAQDNSRTSVAPTTEANKSAPFEPGNAVPLNQQPVPVPWEIALGVLAIVSAVATWLVRRNNERQFRERWKQK